MQDYLHVLKLSMTFQTYLKYKLCVCILVHTKEKTLPAVIASPILVFFKVEESERLVPTEDVGAVI